MLNKLNARAFFIHMDFNVWVNLSFPYVEYNGKLCKFDHMWPELEYLYFDESYKVNYNIELHESWTMIRKIKQIKKDK